MESSAERKNSPVIWILNKADLLADATATVRSIEKNADKFLLLSVPEPNKEWKTYVAA